MDFTTKKHNLEWGIERSIRYHMRRESFFLALHRVVMGLNVLLATAAATALLQKFRSEISAYTLFAVAVISTCDLVVGFASRATLHRELRSRFNQLKAQLVHVTIDDELGKIEAERYSIEADEPPKKQALDVLCHNELMHARGYDPNNSEHSKHIHHVAWWKRITAQIFSWDMSPPTRPN